MHAFPPESPTVLNFAKKGFWVEPGKMIATADKIPAWRRFTFMFYVRPVCLRIGSSICDLSFFFIRWKSIRSGALCCTMAPRTPIAIPACSYSPAHSR